jgi:hypothetical protein
MMKQSDSNTSLYTPAFVDEHFDRLREAAVHDLTSYVSGWSIYTIDFLNAVAELQGNPKRLSAETVVALRKGPKRIREPRLAELLREADDARSLKISEVIELVAAKAVDRTHAHDNRRFLVVLDDLAKGPALHWSRRGHTGRDARNG